MHASVVFFLQKVPFVLMSGLMQQECVQLPQLWHRPTIAESLGAGMIEFRMVEMITANFIVKLSVKFN